MGEDETYGDDASEERRLFGEERAIRVAFAACGLGIARISLADDRIGHAGLLERCTATSVAADEQQLLAGTVQGVLADTGDGIARLGDPFEVAAVAVSADGRLLAAGEDNSVVRWHDTRGWEPIGVVTGPRRFDGSVLAAADGVFRITDSVEPLGLSDVTDIAVGESLLAATHSGIYRLSTGDDWVREYDSPTAAIVTDGERAHAVDEQGIVERVNGEWQRLDAPELPVDLAYGEHLYGITADGTVVVNADASDPTEGQQGWRRHPLGLRGVVELAVR